MDLMMRRRIIMFPKGEPKPASDGKIWLYFETTSANESRTIAYSLNNNTPMWVDGVQVTPSTSYTFPEIGEHLVQLSLNSLAAYQFNGCGATKAYLPAQIVSLPANCFNNSQRLREITLYGSVTSLASAALANCPQCYKVTIYATTPPTLGASNVFFNAPANQVLFVPYSSDHSVLEAYKTWDSTKSRYMFELAANGTEPLYMLSYLDSSGAQYIMTKVKPSSATRLVVDAAMLSLGGTLAGADFSLHSFYIKSGASDWEFRGGNTIYTFSTPSPDLSRHIFEIRGDGTCSIDSYTGQVGTTGGALPINLFTGSVNTSGNPDTNNYVSMRFYGAAIKNGDTITHNFVPARINQYAGIYDSVLGAFYLSETPTDFIAGPDITQ